jgi:acetyl esterase/lipase
MSGPTKDRELTVRGISKPFVTVFRPAHPDGRAVLSIPGGGFSMEAVTREGVNLARALTPHGVTVFVLTYRLPGEGWHEREIVGLHDAQRAMRLIRANSRRLNIDPNKLGVVGFSAGGLLAGLLAVRTDRSTYLSTDQADSESAKPCFVGLIYPITNLADKKLNPIYAKKLFGANQDDAKLETQNVVKQLTPQMPPLFLVDSLDDDRVPPEQSFSLVAAAHRARVPIEAHFIPRGGHGFGVYDEPVPRGQARWDVAFDRWTTWAVQHANSCPSHPLAS